LSRVRDRHFYCNDDDGDGDDGGGSDWEWVDDDDGDDKDGVHENADSKGEQKYQYLICGGKVDFATTAGQVEHPRLGVLSMLKNCSWASKTRT
jgi:hypothetical protein